MQTDPKFLTVQKCLLGLAFLVYLVGVFHLVVFEATHILTHQFSDEVSFHFHHHTGERHANHEHAGLERSKEIFEESNESPTSRNEQPKLSIDKIQHIVNQITSQKSVVELKKKAVFSFDLQLPATPFLHTPTPPPDFAA